MMHCWCNIGHGRPCASRGKTAAKPFVLSRCTSRARPPSLKCLLRLSSAAQFSGKAHKVCNLTTVSAVVHWCLSVAKFWKGSNSLSSHWHPHCGLLWQLVEVLASLASWPSTHITSACSIRVMSRRHSMDYTFHQHGNVISGPLFWRQKEGERRRS